MTKFGHVLKDHPINLNKFIWTYLKWQGGLFYKVGQIFT
jgi:hypothetical protein